MNNVIILQIRNILSKSRKRLEYANYLTLYRVKEMIPLGFVDKTLMKLMESWGKRTGHKWNHISFLGGRCIFGIRRSGRKVGFSSMLKTNIQYLTEAII